jgi:hypothetical protein
MRRQHAVQVDRGAGAEQAMVVVDEVRIPVIHPFVIRNMGIGGMNPHTFGDDFVQWTIGTNEFVIDIAGALLVAHQAAILQPVIETSHGAAGALLADVHIHLGFLRLSSISVILRLT